MAPTFSLTPMLLIIGLAAVILLPLLSYPPFIGVYLFFITIVVVLTLYTTASSWIAMIIFIVYIGGLLVIFSYFFTIRSNALRDIPTLLWISLYNFTICIAIEIDLRYRPPKPDLSARVILGEDQSPILFTLLFVLFIILIIAVFLTKWRGSIRPFSANRLSK